MSQICAWFTSSEIARFSRNVEFGEMIEIERGLFQHWVVYIGRLSDVKETVDAYYYQKFVDILTCKGFARFLYCNDFLVLELNTQSMLIGASSCGSFGRSGCSINRLVDVAGDSKFRVRYEYQEPKPDDEMMESIIEHLKGNHPPYNAITYNCEHVANAVRYGRPVSNQSITNVAHGAVCVAAILFPPIRAVTLLVTGFRIFNKLWG